jgi:hypothetical protein
MARRILTNIEVCISLVAEEILLGGCFALVSVSFFSLEKKRKKGSGKLHACAVDLFTTT